MRPPPPSPSEQIAFLGNIERLLSEGQFVATYKYALLVAIADLAVQLGTDDGAELDLPLLAIAEQFLELYWRQSAPYGVSANVPDVLIQNTGRQAAVISTIRMFQLRFGTLMKAKASDAWKTATGATIRLLKSMPLWRLQVLRNETLPFLYDEDRSKSYIRLKPGVSANVRRFHGMIIRMAQSEWLRFIQALPQNAPLLGPTSDLGQFLFGAERGALAAMAKPLAEIQKGACLYCEHRVTVGEIDHFIPWSRYPRDMAHNLVLAHQECNRRKSDLLASEDHLDRWLLRNREYGQAISDVGRTLNLIVDYPATRGVANWAYSHGSAVGAQAWLNGDQVEPLSGRWRSLLA